MNRDSDHYEVVKKQDWLRPTLSILEKVKCQPVPVPLFSQHLGGDEAGGNANLRVHGSSRQTELHP